MADVILLRLDVVSSSKYFSFLFVLASRSDSFIIGLTDVSPLVTAPTLWNYAVCGQYPGEVGSGATVILNCTCGLAAYRYLIVQFPGTDWANFCELEVYIRRKYLDGKSVITCQSIIIYHTVHSNTLIY